MRRHSDSGWLASTPKKLSAGSRPRGDSLARANQLLGNSRAQSVMYLPPNTPSRSISRRRELRLEFGIEAAAGRRRQRIAVALLHLVVDGDGALAHGRSERGCAKSTLNGRVLSSLTGERQCRARHGKDHHRRRPSACRQLLRGAGRGLSARRASRRPRGQAVRAGRHDVRRHPARGLPPRCNRSSPISPPRARRFLACDHVVFVFPLWCGDMPAIMKGFIERIMQPDLLAIQAAGGKGDWKMLQGQVGARDHDHGHAGLVLSLVFRRPCAEAPQAATSCISPASGRCAPPSTAWSRR